MGRKQDLHPSHTPQKSAGTDEPLTTDIGRITRIKIKDYGVIPCVVPAIVTEPTFCSRNFFLVLVIITHSHFIHLMMYISIDIPYTIHTYFGQLYFIHLDIHFLIYSVPGGGPNDLRLHPCQVSQGRFLQ